MKYNVGDKILLIDMSYFQNYYHFQTECIREFTVLDADEKYFSPYHEKYDSNLSGSNMYSIIRQEDGVPINGGARFYHKTKDADLITDMINEAAAKYDEFCKANDAQRKIELEETIRDCQEEIEKIEQGDGQWKSGGKKFNNKEYRNRVISAIRKVFPL